MIDIKTWIIIFTQALSIELWKHIFIVFFQVTEISQLTLKWYNEDECVNHNNPAWFPSNSSLWSIRSILSMSLYPIHQTYMHNSWKNFKSKPYTSQLFLSINKRRWIKKHTQYFYQWKFLWQASFHHWNYTFINKTYNVLRIFLIIISLR